MVNEGKGLDGTGVTEAWTIMPRAYCMFLVPGHHG